MVQYIEPMVRHTILMVLFGHGICLVSGIDIMVRQLDTSITDGGYTGRGLNDRMV